MHAYLIIANREQGTGESEKLIKKLGIKRLDFVVKKIADVRELGKFTKLKLSEKTAIVISDFDEVGEEAQNAFLKALEEPQENLIYILTAQNLDNVLPTIISRCEVIQVSSGKYQVTREEAEKVKEFVDASIGDKLRITAKITKRDEAIEFMNNLIIVGHELFLKEAELGLFLGEAGKTLAALKANGNVQLQLTNFVVNVEK